jgi:two-component system chemotaxis sensor kinase CheA
MSLAQDELEDRIEQIFDATEKLHEVAADGRTTCELLDSIFRNVHSLKASAAANNLSDLTHIAHEFENLLHSLRVGKLRLNNQVLKAFDDISEAMFSSVQSPTAGIESNAELFARLRSLTETAAENGLGFDENLKNVPKDVWQSLSEEELHKLRLTISEGASLFLLSVSFAVGDFDEQFQLLRKQLLNHGEVISTSPTVAANKPDNVDFRILYACDLDLDELQRIVPGLEQLIINDLSSGASIPSHSWQTNTRKSYEQNYGSRHLRIDLDDLDRLIASTQQLFRDTSECFALATDHISKTEVDAVSSSFMKLAADLANLRVVPIDRVLQRAYRAGRSAADAAGKVVSFVVTGNDIKIDKALADIITDPLIHLVRNAVDHGIETDAERISAGKDKRGVIRIQATTRQGRTTIRVIDDGRGIDSEAVGQAAKRLGLVAKDAKIGLRQSVRLIFRTGFSTTSNISELSGRGMGLDVVETAIEEVGGAIRVESHPGVGSVFEILLPVTFSLLDVVVVRVGNFRYLIDRKLVLSEAVNVAPLNSAQLQRFTLDELLGFDTSNTQPTTALICRFDDPKSVRSVALEVSEVVGTERVLVRNLGSRGGRWLGVAGAAEMRDGTVALLLDLPTLIAVASS